MIDDPGAGPIAGYNGSGGGAGIDLASVGLSSINFVRISTPIRQGIETDPYVVDSIELPEKSASIAGKAMLTMKRSRLAMNSPTEVIKRTFQRCSMRLHSSLACNSQGTVSNSACKRKATG